MNERIRQLYYECQDESQSTEQCYQKFAELIVQECLEIVEDEDDGSQDTIAVRWAMHRIRKHFGVK